MRLRHGLDSSQLFKAALRLMTVRGIRLSRTDVRSVRLEPDRRDRWKETMKNRPLTDKKERTVTAKVERLRRPVRVARPA